MDCTPYARKALLNMQLDLQKKARKPRTKAPVAMPVLTGRYAAIDFETADYPRNSACAVSLIIVENDQVVERITSLIRPPQRTFSFTYIHGISWNDVKNAPSFGEIWPEIAQAIEGVDFLAAHNASFDRSVLNACCELIGHEPTVKPFLCTVKLARATWNLSPAKLSDVASHLQIPLNHHNAESDAFACAQIMLRARANGHLYEELLLNYGLKPARKKV